jgi:hypothetical protein
LALASMGPSKISQASGKASGDSSQRSSPPCAAETLCGGGTVWNGCAPGNSPYFGFGRLLLGLTLILRPFAGFPYLHGRVS